MSRTRSVVSSLACLLLGATTVVAADRYDSLRQLLDQRRQELKAPGALVGVYRPGHADFEAALGLANVERGTRLTTEHAFRIGSISKMFVGQTVLILAGEGKLSLDDAIAKYVDGVPNGNRIALRDLGTHRSGLFNHIESARVKRLFAENPTKSWSVDELVRFCITGPTYFEPGSKHHYANGNTILLAKVIERVTGRPWDTQVRARVVAPLGLEHTIIPSDNKLPQPHAEGYSLGTDEGPFFHRGDKLIRVTDTSPSWWGPAGSMISTLGDLRKVAKPLAQGALLTEAMRRQLHRWTTTDEPDYEYGFQITRVKGGVGHDGDTPGYQACMYYLPEYDAVVVAMANLYGWSACGMPADDLAWLAVAELGIAPK